MRSIRRVLPPFFVALCVACGVEGDPTDATCDDGTCDVAARPNAAGTTVTEAERQAIIALLGDRQVELDQVASPMFVLHDTAGATSNSFMAKQATDSRGPLSDGPAVYLSSDQVHFARPFFDRWRPTSTLFERAKDILQEVEVARLGRQLWTRVDAASRTRAIQDVLAPLPLSEAERQAELASASRQLAGEGPRLFTTATWAVELLCASSFASDPVCPTLNGYAAIHNERVERSVNIELGQVAGSNCAASGARLSPYSDTAYSNLLLVYLQAALTAGVYPETATHFQLDAAFRGHCDPRCFDLDRLYRSIAAALGHDPATVYGVTPSYGTTYGKQSVWWSEAICGPTPRSP
jgi:hypothetical protein